MYRYQGNTGRYVRVPEQTAQRSSGHPAPPTPVPQPQPPRQPGKTMPPPLDLGSGLGSILSGVLPDGFEMEDLLLLLVLFLLYRETGDKELLIMMGAMFLL